MTSAPPATVRAKRIAVLLPSLNGGGAERSMLTLIEGFLARGREVDLLLCKLKGPLLEQVPDAVRVVELDASNNLFARLYLPFTRLRDLAALLLPVVLASKIAPEVARVRSLGDYLGRRRPDVVLSALTYANLAAVWARRASGNRTPLVLSERIALSTYCAAPPNRRKWRWRYLPALVRRTYPEAEAIVGVSGEVCRELSDIIGLDHPRLLPIYNPVVDSRLCERAAQPSGHPWLDEPGPPVVLAAGRLAHQKDFATLLHAFARLRAEMPARLIVLGEGELEAELRSLAGELGITADFDLPGFVDNPFSYMSRAGVFVLSSRYEGLSGVLIQAIGCGCPVVSTDCPGGAAEILGDEGCGRVVPVGDVAAMADAIRGELTDPASPQALQARAQRFTVERAVDEYLALLDEVVGAAVPAPERD